MDATHLVHILMRCAVNGASKTQTLRYIKEHYNQTDKQIEQLLNLCQFKTKPKFIDYKYFANRPIPVGTNKFNFPFTQIHTFNNFLTLDECCKLIEAAEENLRPSTISTPDDKIVTSQHRTSRTADLYTHIAPYLKTIDNKICSLMGLDPFVGEVMQIQKYAVGEYYKEHTDYFHPLTKEYKTYTEWMGQRTWTFMVYLNDVEEGGETYFRHLKLKIKPKQGMAVFWNNLYENGLFNPKTLHEACPPASGDKYVVTKWFRSWPLI